MEESPNKRVGVVIPAAGKGLRLGGERKQFRRLDGKPLLYWTVLLFESHELVDSIVIAAPEQEVELVRELLVSEGITKLSGVVSGGSTRQESVKKALEALSDSVDVAIIHDAVRLFVEKKAISQVIEAIHRDGAAALAVPVTDTLRAAEEHAFGRTVPREGLYRMQTPQGARVEWLYESFRKATQMGWNSTDDVDVLMKAGYSVQVVAGSSLNYKITTLSDWRLAQVVWPLWIRGDLTQG